MQPDGYVKIKDRSKDIIISGGENISSLEVEDVLYRHPAVLGAAVVAMPDEKWGETPCAFVELKPEFEDLGERDHRVLPPAPGQVQGAARRGVRRAAQDLHGQDPEIPAARESQVHFRHRHMSAVPQADQPYLLREDRDGICTLTLNRPQQMNLLTSEMLSALQKEFDDFFRNDTKIRVVILAASGKGFCAGHDLKEIRALKELPKIEQLFGQCSRMMQTITALPQPVIARVQGAAAAAGCQLVAQCDLAIASDAAKFVTSGRDLGLLLLHPRRRHRPQPPAQARDGDAPHRRPDRRAAAPWSGVW